MSRIGNQGPRRALGVYMVFVIATILFVIDRPFVTYGLDEWSHWSFVSVIFSAFYAVYLVRKIYSDEKWTAVYREISGHRSLMLFLGALPFVISALIFGSLVSLFDFRKIDLPGTITLVISRVPVFDMFVTFRDIWHTGFVFLAVSYVSVSEFLIVRKIERPGNSTHRQRLKRILKYVNLPAIVGFGILLAYLVLLSNPIELVGSRSFISGAEAFQLLALNLVYAITATESYRKKKERSR